MAALSRGCKPRIDALNTLKRTSLSNAVSTQRAREKFFDGFSWNNPISMNLITIEKKTFSSFQ